MQRDIQEGMVVRSQDGEKVGTVTRCTESDFVVEKGLLFRRDFLVRYDEVAEIRDREVLLTRAASDEVLRQRERGDGRGPREDVVPLGTFGKPQDIVVELAAEEAIPRTVVREAGALRIRKVVRTEMKEFRIPVRREELHVERVPADRLAAGELGESSTAPGAAPLTSTAGAGALEWLRSGEPFSQGTLVIPLHEERVEFTTSAHVWQEVHLRKEALEELAQVRTQVRREVAEVSESGKVSHDGPLDGLH
jgi:stress response protein YsnF